MPLFCPLQLLLIKSKEAAINVFRKESLILRNFRQSYVAELSYTISQKKMTTTNIDNTEQGCPAEGLLKQLSGKWKPQIFRIALEKPIRFNSLLREIPQSNKQSIAVALKELEEQGLLDKVIIKQKPLHIEYTLSDKGKALIPIFKQLEQLSL